MATRFALHGTVAFTEVLGQVAAGLTAARGCGPLAADPLRRPAIARARLTIDLAAVAANWQALDALSAPAVETGAVVKADAYGLGAARVGPALAAAGARSFFVALAEEGAALREALGPGPAIHVFAGLMPGDAPSSAPTA